MPVRRNFWSLTILEKIFFDEIHELQKTVEDNPEQVRRLEEGEKLIQEWVDQITASAIALRREVNNGKKTMNDLDAYVSQKKSKKYFDAFRKKLKHSQKLKQT